MEFTGGMTLIGGLTVTQYIPPPSNKAIFGYGSLNENNGLSMTNLVSNTGVVSSDTTGVGTARFSLAAAGYGTDKAIFGYGQNTGSPGNAGYSLTNLVTNTGVVGNDVAGVGTACYRLSAATYGTDKAIFGYSTAGTKTNKVSNTGVVAADTTGVGTSKNYSTAAGYGTDKAIFGFGLSTATTNLVSNTGVVSSDQAAVTGTARGAAAAATYGTDKAIFGYGSTNGSSDNVVSITNLVSNTGVVASNTTGVGTARQMLAAAGYGVDTAIFGYGYSGPNYSITNQVSNTGVVATDTTGVGTGRNNLAASTYGLS